MIKKGNLYLPTKEIKDRAWIKDKKIYKQALKDPVGFWEDLAKEIFWQKKWKKGFIYKPPYFQWFAGGKLNITESIFEKNSLGFENIKDKLALIWEPESIQEKERRITYEELFKQVNKFANALKKLGVKKGDRIGIYLPMIPEVIISILACARIGAIHSVVFSAFSSIALQARLKDTQAKILITADGYYRRGEVVDLKRSADQALKQTEVKKVIVVKRIDNQVSFKKNRDLWYEDLIKNQDEKCPAKIMDAEDTLFILYTSGSTGKPKGCVHICGGYAVQTKFTGKWIFDWHNEDIFWSMADIGWITGHTYSCYAPLLNGITFLIYEGAPDWPFFDRWAQIIEKHKITVFYTAPTAIRMFEKYGTVILKKYKFDKLRILGSVGEPINKTAWQWFFEKIGKKRCPILDTWWQTETGGILISSLPGIGPFKPSFTGLPFPGIKAEIVNEKGKFQRPNQQGDLVILPPFSPGFFRGIYKNPKKYKETYWKEYGSKIYFTSDAAYKDKQGLIRIVGRIDDVLKVAGHRLTTGELENIISLHPDIIECAVIGKKDEIKGEVPVIFAVSRKDKKRVEKLKKEIIEKIKKEIGPIALPKEIYIVEDLPKTRSGKIMRRILKKLFTGEELGDLSTLVNQKNIEEIKRQINEVKIF